MTKHGSWLEALEKQGLEVQSARDAMQVKGWLDTGNYALNWAISGRLLRGYPLGHTVEIFGDPATGKSFLVARALAMVQKAGGVALLDDTEGGYSLEHVASLGVDIQHLAYRRSRTVKDHLDTALAFVKAYKELKLKVPALLAVDSLALLSTEHELEAKLDKRDMSKAAELRTFFRIVSGELFEIPALHLSTNHKIAAIGNLFQNTTTPGGGGPKYMSSVRLDLRATSKIKGTADYLGVIVRVVVDKNRFTSPWKEVRLAIPFNQPISKASGLVPLLIALGILNETGTYVEFNGQRLGRSFKTKEHFLDQDELGEQLLDQVPEILEETDAKLEEGKLGTGPQAEVVVDTETGEIES